MMPDYNVGYRVRAIKNHPDGNDTIVFGSTGEVVVVRDRSEDRRCVGVCWDEEIDGGHTLYDRNGHHCEPDHGWWCKEDEIERFFDEELEAPDLSDSDFMKLFCGTE